MDLVECGSCGRRFNETALVRHSPICAKNQKKKPRKAFDSQKNRLVGTEVNYNEVKRKEKMGPSQKELKAAARKDNWREKHHNLVTTIKAARGEDDGYDDYQSNNYSNHYQQQPRQRQQQQQQYNGHSSYNSPPVRAAAAPPGRTGPAKNVSRIPTQSRVPAGYANVRNVNILFTYLFTY